MVDPLTQLIALLRPRTIQSKAISGAGAWAVRYADFGQPSFCVVLEGSCRLALKGHAAATLAAGDFVFLPSTPGFTLSGFEPAKPVDIEPRRAVPSRGEVRHGRKAGRPDVRLLGGYFVFESPDTSLLASLLPRVVHVRGIDRLATLVRWLDAETRASGAGRELVLVRLVELMLIEALRATSDAEGEPGLLRGLADARLAASLRQVHADPARAWTIADLAEKASLSRSAFFERFVRAVGMPPMEYLLAWRMAIAKDLLRREDLGVDKVAERVGYSSASAFSTAFRRQVGQSPGRFARSDITA
jgi:AraC-like DNA-binding protein